MKYLFLLGVLFLLVNNVSVAQTGTDDRVYERREVTQPARILSKPEPSFTDEARQNDVDGVVRLRLVLAASGKVTDISVIEGLPYGLTDNALKAAKEIKFTPAIKDGRAVSQYMEAEYNFTVWFNAGEVSHLAEITYSPTPEVTDEARQKKVHGSVVLRIGFTRRGQVVIAGVVKGLPYGLTERQLRRHAELNSILLLTTDGQSQFSRRWNSNST